MELFYILLVVIILAILLGLLVRHRGTLKHFFDSMGMLKVIIFSLLSLLLICISLIQENGVSSVLLPTVLGLALNGLIFTVFLDYMKYRDHLKVDLSKLSVMNDLIGNSVYHFQSSSGIDFESYKDGRKLQKIKWDTIEKMYHHYKKPSQLTQSEIDYFGALGRQLSSHIPIYTTMLSSTYAVDSKLARIWTEIIFSMESLSTVLTDFDKDVNDCKDELERRGLVYITSHRIHEYFGKLIEFNLYKTMRYEQMKL